MTQTLFALLAAGAGACLALQATVNTRFRENLDSTAYATFLPRGESASVPAVTLR